MFAQGHSSTAMNPSILTLVWMSLLVSLVQTVFADDVIMQKRYFDNDNPVAEPIRRKKPFCNAFTGCGRKRSDESMATLVDLRSEPAVEEISRQIMSEAKLWEAIQEARLELLRQQRQNKAERMEMKPFNMGLRRKRRSLATSDKC
ncbi:cardioactive peptide isoform X1 [Myzus persicae]|uniref:cardioactive peptide isoform X1 n=2 Tax=Myzus persicae TaxID=13164 RepID=UPI000B937C43|nr:cardioactive peptide isoform X1 [Myzus persicae]